MTKEQVIAWAKEAGFVIDEKARQHQPNCIFHTHHMVDELLSRFATLVAAAEREACAKVCDDNALKVAAGLFRRGQNDYFGGHYFARAIRARSKE